MYFSFSGGFIWLGAIDGGKILMVPGPVWPLLIQAASDAAAAIAGVRIGGLYRSGSQVMQRQS